MRVRVRWRVLPDFLAMTLGIDQRPNGAAGPGPAALPAEPEPHGAAAGGDTDDAVELATVTTLPAEFASPPARGRDFPAVRLVRVRCRLRRGRRRCVAACPPGGMVIGGGPDALPAGAEVEGSGPAGAGAWAVDLRSPADAEGAPVAVWAMCV